MLACHKIISVITVGLWWSNVMTSELWAAMHARELHVAITSQLIAFFLSMMWNSFTLYAF